jgi:hypothetical protein
MERPDSQLVELAGTNWLMSQLLQARVEVAKPERDRGIDLIAYIDLDESVGDFIACPIQIKAASERAFGLDPKYERFPRLLLVHVWHVSDSHRTKAFAMTYLEALKIATDLGWTETASWKTGASSGRRGYSVHQIGDGHKLMGCLRPYEMTIDKWKGKIIAIGQQR